MAGEIEEYTSINIFLIIFFISIAVSLILFIIGILFRCIL